MPSSRCLLVFSPGPRAEGAAKGLGGAGPLFDLARRRLAAAAADLRDVTLFSPAQRGGTFGERLGHAVSDARARGFESIVIVPGDSPGLGRRQIEQAFEALERTPVVFGPSRDGGVYLVGLGPRADSADLFARVRWKTRRAASDLRLAAPQAHWLAETIPDLDHPADVKPLLDLCESDAELIVVILELLGGAPGARLPAAARPGRPDAVTALLRAPPSGAVASL